MDKVAAIRELIHEGRASRLTTTGAKRAVRACKALELDAVGILAIMQTLQYAGDDGTPMYIKVDQVWPNPLLGPQS